MIDKSTDSSSNSGSIVSERNANGDNLTQGINDIDPIRLAQPTVEAQASSGKFSALFSALLGKGAIRSSVRISRSFPVVGSRFLTVHSPLSSGGELVCLKLGGVGGASRFWVKGSQDGADLAFNVVADGVTEPLATFTSKEQAMQLVGDIALAMSPNYTKRIGWLLLPVGLFLLYAGISQAPTAASGPGLVAPSAYKPLAAQSPRLVGPGMAAPITPAEPAAASVKVSPAVPDVADPFGLVTPKRAP